MQMNFATHSTITNPGRFADLLTPLPTSPGEVSEVVQGLIYHYIAGKFFFGYQHDRERNREIDSRDIKRILARLLQLDARPLREARSFENRVVGCCRDFSLLACSILRHHGVPARLRYGFATYFGTPGFFSDHVIVEAWMDGRWVQFDPQLAGVLPTTIDLLDLPQGAFLTGSLAWQTCRAGANPLAFGISPDVQEARGLWFVRGRMQLDLAALRKQEMLCWDEWGFGEEAAELSPANEELLDSVAHLALGNESQLLDLLTTDDRLSLPAEVTCYSPFAGPHLVAQLVK